MPHKVMDEYINEAFMNAIKVGIEDKQLPLDGQQILEKMNLFKKSNIELDLKNSSYGKIGKFLIQKNKEGIIEYKEPKKGQ